MVFSFASIISTGFSSWSIVEVATASVNAGGDGVITLQDMIDIYSPTYDFSFCVDGMVKDHEIVINGTISIFFAVNNSKATNFVSNNKYHAVVIFEETSATDFLTFVSKKPTSSNATSIGDNLSTNSKVIKNKVTFNVSSGEDSSLELKYTVEDTFDSTTKEYQTSKFYSNPPSLSFSVLLETNP